MGLFDWLAGETDTKNEFSPTNFGATEYYDPNSFEYGGYAGGANQMASQYGAMGVNAQNRLGEQVNYGQANQDRALGLGARRQQGAAADLMMQRAQGLAPSIAQMQADRQMQQSQAAQMSAAASARGPAALALAQQQAAGNIAAQQSAISNQAQINAAQERQAAEQAAFGAFSGMRGGDLASQQQSAQQQQYQSQLNAQQRAQNDQFTSSMIGHERGVNEAQLAAQQNRQGLLSGSHQQGQQIQSGVASQNAQTNQGLLGGVVNAVSSGAGMVLGRAAGGPIAPGQPYLVGEQGPELVVPAQAGMVVPAPQTAGLLARAGGPSDPTSVGPQANASFAGAGGMLGGSPMGELKAHSNFATRFQRNAGSGPARGGM